MVHGPGKKSAHFWRMAQQDPSGSRPKPPSGDDWGLSRKLDSTARMMDHQGRFTIRRLHEASHLYHDLLAMSWGRFLLLVVGIYVALNTLFALAYLLVGLEQLNQAPSGSWFQRFGIAFHFSAQTLTTVGYGFFSPQGPVASAIATFEALVGLLSFALATGLVYGRFATPTAGVVFSERAVVAPYGENGTALQVALANGRA